MTDTLYFYSQNQPFAEFSNFSKHGVELDGAWWPTTEHYFQAQKFEDSDYREAIRKVSDPKRAADMGRSRAYPLRADWEDVKVDVMRRAVDKKFRTYPELKALLLGTGDRPIVENAPGDYFWGCGADGSGQNWLGRILLDVRGKLRADV